jgi:hypothetical protein
MRSLMACSFKSAAGPLYKNKNWSVATQGFWNWSRGRQLPSCWNLAESRNRGCLIKMAVLQHSPRTSTPFSEQVRQRRFPAHGPSRRRTKRRPGSHGGHPGAGRGCCGPPYCSSQSRKNGFFWPGVAAGLPCASNPVFAMVSCDVGSAVDASEATGPGGGALKAAGAG